MLKKNNCKKVMLLLPAQLKSLPTQTYIYPRLTPQQVMEKYGKTFALAAKLLNAQSRYDAAQLYAFARTIDDMVDMQATNLQVKTQLNQLKNTFARDHFLLQQVIDKHEISLTVLYAFLQAQANDEDGRQLATQQCLINYAYGVAGSIGSMMRPILGASYQGENYAISLGIAMQLTNIARDLVEDAARKRIYIPASFFIKSLQIHSLENPSVQESKHIFLAITQLLSLADDYYDYARLGYQFIPFRNRLSIAAAAQMYRGIGTQIIKNGYSKYWHGRVSLNNLHKISIAILAIIQTITHAIFPPNSTPNNAVLTSISIDKAIAHYQSA